MILHKLQLSGWRCFADEISLESFSPRINLLHGPNGSGKSTLVTALIRGLFDNHEVTGEAIDSLRPWGRQLYPKVTLEFEHRGTRYRLEKQFLHGAFCRLYRWEGNRFTRLAEGREATQWVRELFAGQAPGRGLTHTQHWGWGQLLLAPQGALHLDQLSEDLCQAIRQSLGEQLAGPGYDFVEQRIQEQYNRYFTPHGRDRRGASGAPIHRLREEYDRLDQEYREARARWDQFEECARRIEDLRLELEQIQHSEAAIQEQLRNAQAQLRQYQELDAQKQLLQQQVQNAQERYQHLDRILHDIETCKQQLTLLRQQLEQLKETSRQRQQQVVLCQNQYDQARQQVETVRTRRQEVQNARRTAEQARRLVSTLTEHSQLASQLGIITQIKQEQQTLVDQRNRIVCPTAQQWRAIQKVVRNIEDAKLRLDSSVITLRVTAEQPVPLDVTVGEPLGARTVASNEMLIIRGRPDVSVRLPGVGTFHATGPVEDITDIVEELEKSQRKFEQLVEPYGTRNLSELEQRMEAATQLENQLEQIDVRLQTLLVDKTVDDLQSQLHSKELIIAAIQEEFPQWKETPPDADLLAQEADRIERQFTTDIDSAEAQQQNAYAALQAAQESLNAEMAKVQEILGRLSQEEARLERLQSDGVSEEERRNQRIEAAMQWQAAQGQLKAVEQQLSQFGEHPERIVQNFTRQLENVRELVQSKTSQLHRLEGQIQSLAQQAPYNQLVMLEEQLAQKQAEIQREELVMGAIRLLYETLTQQKRAATEALLAPVQQRALDTFRRINGGRFTQVTFQDSLVPGHVTPRAVEQSVELSHISGGEREQLYFAVRLALASTLSTEERQLLVLDDVFVYTDHSRLARITSVLEEIAERFQILLLTCHPERFGGLRDAKLFDVQALHSAA